jgi:hypothetical protein
MAEAAVGKAQAVDAPQGSGCGQASPLLLLVDGHSLAFRRF